jgi:phage terminase large subunit GpA-like protein
VAEFAERELVVTIGPLAGMRWSNRFAPYQVGILNAPLEPGVEFTVVMGSSQWGKTACAACLTSFHIAQDPCPGLYVLPTVNPMALDFGKNRLDPLIAASPILRDALRPHTRGTRTGAPRCSSSIAAARWRSAARTPRRPWRRAR